MSHLPAFVDHEGGGSLSPYNTLFIPLWLACTTRGYASSSKQHTCHEEPSRATSLENDSSLRIPWEDRVNWWNLYKYPGQRRDAISARKMARFAWKAISASPPVAFPYVHGLQPSRGAWGADTADECTPGRRGAWSSGGGSCHEAHRQSGPSELRPPHQSSEGGTRNT